MALREARMAEADATRREEYAEAAQRRYAANDYGLLGNQYDAGENLEMAHLSAELCRKRAVIARQHAEAMVKLAR